MRSRRALAGLLPLVLSACASEPPPPEPAAAPAASPAPVASPATPVPYRAPQVDPAPAQAGIGAPLPRDLPWQAVDGRAGTLEELLHDAPAAVVVLTSLRCPLTRLYAPLLRERLDPWRARGVGVLVLDPIPQDEPAALQALAQRLAWDWPVARDPAGAWTRALQAERTTDVFLIDAAGVLRYRGALDDQYGIGYRLPAPRRALLADALEAVLSGREPTVTATRAPGCLLPAPGE